MADILNKAKRKVEESKDTLYQMKRMQKRVMAEAKRIMNKEQYLKCNLVIHGTSGVNAAIGMIPIPVVDAVPISAAQIGMIVSLGLIFGQKVSETLAEAAIKAAAATFLGRTAVKVIPGVGWVVSGVVAGVVTETIGWMVAVKFAKNENIELPDEEPLDGQAGKQENEEKKQSCSSLDERAQPFLSGEKDINTFRKEYDDLVKNFEKVLDSLAGNDPLRNVYDRLTALDI